MPECQMGAGGVRVCREFGLQELRGITAFLGFSRFTLTFSHFSECQSATVPTPLAEWHCGSGRIDRARNLLHKASVLECLCLYPGTAGILPAPGTPDVAPRTSSAHKRAPTGGQDARGPRKESERILYARTNTVKVGCKVPTSRSRPRTRRGAGGASRSRARPPDRGTPAPATPGAGSPQSSSRLAGTAGSRRPSASRNRA
jgi:hypothetical protein